MPGAAFQQGWDKPRVPFSPPQKEGISASPCILAAPAAGRWEGSGTEGPQERASWKKSQTRQEEVLFLHTHYFSRAD